MLFTSKVDTEIFAGDLQELLDVAADAAYGIRMKLQSIDAVLDDCFTEFSLECVRPALGDDSIVFRVILEFSGAQAEAEVFFGQIDGEWKVPTSDDICFAFVEAEVAFGQTRLGGAINEALERAKKRRLEQTSLYTRLEAVSL